MQLNFNPGKGLTPQTILRSSYFTVGEIMKNNARIIPNRIAIEYDGNKLTFTQLNVRVNRLANALGEAGLARGARVAILSENRLEYCEIVYAAAKLGLVIPCLNWRLSADEIRHCIQLTMAEAILVSSRHRGLFEQARKDLPSIKKVILLDEAPGANDEVTYSSLIEKGSEKEPPIEVMPEDALIILYTSGTTGYPKAAVISHRAILGRVWMWVRDLHLNEDDTFLGFFPMYHIACMDHMLVNNIIGAKFIPFPTFDAERICQYLWNEWMGWLVLLPGTFEPVIELLSKFNRKVVRVKCVGAMADLVPPKLIAEITRLTNAPFLNSFASTETGMCPATNSFLPIGQIPKDLSKRANSTCEVRLVDPEDQEVKLGEPGEVVVRGSSLFSGYWNNEAANKESFRGGWFHMGDVMTMNPDGTLNFVDRKKYLIKSGGENIYPAEIERVLLSHQAVDEAVVVRVADPKWGEVPKAYVAIHQPVKEDELIEYCKKHLASYKKPKYIEFVPIQKFPRNTTGKILRHEVEKWHKS